MTDPYLLDAITQIQQLKSSYVLGTTTGFAYAYEKSRIIDNFLVATDRPGNYHNRLQRLDMFRGFLEPLEISEQQLRISGLYRYAPPPSACSWASAALSTTQSSAFCRCIPRRGCTSTAIVNSTSAPAFATQSFCCQYAEAVWAHCPR
jgi:hypothetical protein